MANTNNGKIAKIDTWTSDISIASIGITVHVRKVRLYSAAAGDLLYIEDGLGSQVILIVQTTNGRITEVDFGEGFTFNGLQVDVSDATGLGSGDICWIYMD